MGLGFRGGLGFSGFMLGDYYSEPVAVYNMYDIQSYI